MIRPVLVAGRDRIWPVLTFDSDRFPFGKRNKPEKKAPVDDLPPDTMIPPRLL
jgi:hypothetical protein